MTLFNIVKKIFFVACVNISLLSALVQSQPVDFSKLSVYSKDLDGTATGQQWRRLVFQIHNNGDTSIDISTIRLVYSITDSSNSILSETWYYNVHNENWSIQGGQNSEVHASIKYYESDPVAVGNRDLVLQFDSRILPKNGIAEIQIGLHNSNWANLNENNDPSYILSTNFVSNNKIKLEDIVPNSINTVLNQVAQTKGVNPNTGSITSSFAQTFSDLNGSFYSKKYLDNLGNPVIVTVNDNGTVFDLDSLPVMNRRAQIQKYGTELPQLHTRIQHSGANTIIPVLIHTNLSGISFAQPQVITTDATVDYNTWKTNNDNVLQNRKSLIHSRALVLANKIDSIVQAYPSLVGFDPQISIDDYTGIISCKLPASIISNLSNDALTTMINDCDSITPKEDMWTAGYRMNVDNLHANGDSGTGIKSAVWEGGYPNFENQMYVPAANVRYSRKTIADSMQFLYSYYTKGKADTLIYNDTMDQHVAYMLAAIRNNRTKKTDAGAPTTFCGTGFAPNSELYLGDYTVKYTGEYLVNDMFSSPIKWCLDKGVSVINQSWHTTKSYGTVTRGASSYGFDAEFTGDNTFDDQYIDLIASTYPYPTFCQAVGNIEDAAKYEYANHKGYNTIVVGQDANLGTGGMVSTSVYNNPTNKQELPHVTAGVSIDPGVSMFENPDGSSVVTPNGATSLASAMCTGFATSIQSVNPTLLKNSPWAVRAILMAGADNVFGSTWSDDATVDQKDGAGRLNGINSLLIAQNPYSSGVGAEHGFYISEIPANTSYTKEITIKVTNPSINNAVNNGYLRIALSWIGNVDPNTYVSSLSDLDLELLASDQSVIARSASIVNPVEVIYVKGLVKDQQYTIRIKTSKNVGYNTPFAVAWVNR